MLASSGYLMPRLESRPEVLHVLPGVNAAAMGLMMHVCFGLVRSPASDILCVALTGLRSELLEKAQREAEL